MQNWYIVICTYMVSMLVEPRCIGAEKGYSDFKYSFSIQPVLWCWSACLFSFAFFLLSSHLEPISCSWENACSVTKENFINNSNNPSICKSYIVWCVVIFRDLKMTIYTVKYFMLWSYSGQLEKMMKSAKWHKCMWILTCLSISIIQLLFIYLFTWSACCIRVIECTV